MRKMLTAANSTSFANKKAETDTETATDSAVTIVETSETAEADIAEAETMTEDQLAVIPDHHHHTADVARMTDIASQHLASPTAMCPLQGQPAMMVVNAPAAQNLGDALTLATEDLVETTTTTAEIVDVETPRHDQNDQDVAPHLLHEAEAIVAAVMILHPDEPGHLRSQQLSRW